MNSKAPQYISSFFHMVFILETRVLNPLLKVRTRQQVKTTIVGRHSFPEVSLALVLECFSLTFLKTLLFSKVFQYWSYSTRLKCNKQSFIYWDEEAKRRVPRAYLFFEHAIWRVLKSVSPFFVRKCRDTYRYTVQTWKSRNTSGTLKSQTIKQSYKSY